MHSSRKPILAFVLLAAVGLSPLPAARATSATFTFDLPGDMGKTTTFTDAVNGLSATFSSPGVTNGFTDGMIGVFAPPISGNMLYTTSSPAPLNILFSQPISVFSLNFATNDFGTANPLLLTAFSGGATGTQVGTTSATGVVPTGYNFPQGTLSFSSATPFNDIRLTSASPGFVVDNVQIGTSLASVPEADALSLLALGLVGLSLPLLRARRRRA